MDIAAYRTNNNSIAYSFRDNNNHDSLRPLFVGLLCLPQCRQYRRLHVVADLSSKCSMSSADRTSVAMAPSDDYKKERFLRLGLRTNSIDLCVLTPISIFPHPSYWLPPDGIYSSLLPVLTHTLLWR